MNWPTTLQESPDGSVLMPNGTTAAKIPSDQAVEIVVSPDGKYFAVFVSGAPGSEVAACNSATNKFTWVCEKGAPTTCPAGGVPATDNTDSTNS